MPKKPVDAMLPHEGIFKTLQRQIKGSKKEITILFTDIESSMTFWDTRGDIMGRLMIDYHNRLIFPFIKKFKGKVVKTIGDAVMASFKKPHHAVLAAMAIQQILHQERMKNKELPKVRIGIHTGGAIVEKGDIYGDTVNMASRIESRAKGNEILMSTRTARRMSQKEFFLERKTRFKPKGKKEEITVYKCNWNKAPSLIEDLKSKQILKLSKLQKWEIGGATFASLIMFLVFLFRYIRFLFMDSEILALLLFNPKHILLANPLLIVFCVIFLTLIILVIFRLRRVQFTFFKLVFGGMGFFIGFFIIYLPFTLLTINLGLKSEKVLYAAKHSFVEIIANQAPIYNYTSEDSLVVRNVPKGMLLLHSDQSVQNTLIWNRVLIGREQHGWILEVSPPKIGIPEQELSILKTFEFKVKDIYPFIAGLLGFIWGFFYFKVKPR